MKKNILCLNFIISLTLICQHKLPELEYSYDALEPYIDKQTMIIHHTKHHQGYVDNLNKEISNYPEIEKLRIEEICKSITKYNMAVRNNAGGHYNHTLFWKLLSPTPTSIGKKTQEWINKEFGSFDNFKNEFTTAAKSRFGSGWAWLILTNNKKLAITTTPNQDNPLMPVAELQGEPILALDVWEHAYYLKYQNRRSEYIDAFWNIINWNYVEELLNKALSRFK